MDQRAQEDSKDEGEEESEIPVKQKVAIVMVALGEEASGEVMKHLSDFEIEEITQSIAGLKNIGVDVMDKILEEFETHLMAGDWIGQGGVERVRTFITEEMEYQGPMRVSEVEEVQLRIVQQVRQLEEQGQVTIVRGDSDDQFV